MVDTIEKVLKPFFLILCFHGFGIFRNNSSYLRFCLNIFSILIPLSAYAHVIYYVISIVYATDLGIDFLGLFVLMADLFVTIISTIITFRKREKFYMCVRNLDLVDDTLELLRIPKEYRKMRNSIKWILIIWFMIVCIMVSLWYYYLLDMEDITMEDITLEFITLIVMACIIGYIFYLNSLMDTMIIFVLRYIGTRFDKINGCIEQLSETEKCGLRYTWKKSPVNRYYVQSSKNRKHILWISMHLHLELCRIARNIINDCFGTHMTLQTIFNFVFLTTVIYFQYRVLLCFTKFDENSEETVEVFVGVFFVGIIYCIVCLIKLVTLNYICESVSIKAKKTLDIIHKLTNLVYFDQMREDICQFTFQMLLQPLKFDGMGLFYFGYKLIFKFIMGIVNIMLFMVGMGTSSLSRNLLSDDDDLTCFE